jgi:hypothetical protein
MKVNSTYEANGVSVTNGNDKITFGYSGTYNIQFSTLFNHSTANSTDIDVWFSKNGSYLTQSNTKFTIAGNSALVASWNFINTVNANDYIQIYWSSPETTVSIQTSGTQSNPIRPAVPSVIITAQQIMYSQLGSTGSSGSSGTSGSSGSSGESGSSGTSGSSGSSGTSGLLLLTGTTNNGIITLDGSAPNATVESNLTFDGNTLRANANATTVPLIIASGSSTQDLVRITQTGTGNAFVVEDSANPDGTMFVIASNGNVGIGSSPAAGRLYVQDSTNPAIYGYSTNGTGIIGVGTGADTPGVKGQGNIGVYGIAQADTGTLIGVQGIAGESDTGSGTYIGGYFGVGSANGTNYSLRLLDGTEGVDKLLTSVTADGHANWKSDIKVTSIIASASSTTDIVRITQTGTGNALVVEDSTNPDATPFVISNSGNVGIGTVSTSDKLWVSGDVTITGTMSGSNNKILTDTLIQAGLLYLSNNC